MAEAVWYYAKGQQQVGPLTLGDLVAQIRTPAGDRTLVYGPATGQWVQAAQVPEIAAALRAGVGPGSNPPPVPQTRRADEIDYEIFGSEMQYVEVHLDPGESVTAEPGMMMYMSPVVQMQTHFGSANQQNQGVLGKLMTAGKRALTGESMFITSFTNPGRARETIAFAAPYPGKIIPMQLHELGGQIIVQKDAFMAAARGVEINIAFQKKIGVALFGGEGFIMQRLTGDGLTLVHAGGSIHQRKLAPGQTLKVDTGCIVALQPSVQYDIQLVGGFKNTLFGGEGLFFATLTGPGDIWLQSLPFSRLAGRLAVGARGGKEEGSILGGLGGLLDGDNT